MHPVRLTSVFLIVLRVGAMSSTATSTAIATSTATSTFNPTALPFCNSVHSGSVILTSGSNNNTATFDLFNDESDPINVIGQSSTFNSNISWDSKAQAINPAMDITTLRLTNYAISSPMWQATGSGLSDGQGWPAITVNNIIPAHTYVQLIASFSNVTYNFNDPMYGMSSGEFTALFVMQVGSSTCSVLYAAPEMTATDMALTQNSVTKTVTPTATATATRPIPVPTYTNAPVCSLIQLGSITVATNNNMDTVAVEIINHDSNPVQVVSFNYMKPYYYSYLAWDTNAQLIDPQMQIVELALSSYPSSSPMWQAAVNSAGLISGEWWPSPLSNNTISANATVNAIATFGNVTYPFTGSGIYSLSPYDFDAVIAVQDGSTICSLYRPNNGLTPTVTPFPVTNTPTVTLTATLTATQNVPGEDSISIFRAGTFYLRLHNSTGNADLTVALTVGTKPYPVVGDWTGAGFDTVGVFDQSNGQFTLCTANVTATCANSANQKSLVLGVPNDQPLSGRWLVNATNSGVGVFRPSNGLIYLKTALVTGYADYTMVLGIPGDIGLAGDWNDKGFDSPGVYRPSNSTFYLSNQVKNGSVFGDYQFAYGLGGDAPVVGDWIAQGHDGIGLFRQSNGFTYLKNLLTTGYADNSFTYGIAGDLPVAGHWQAVYPPVPPISNPAPILIAKTAVPIAPSNSIGGNDPIGD